MKVLLIGAKGMLGQELQKVFAASHEVVSWDREDIDITKKEVVSTKLSVLRPGLVINAAAYNDVDGAESKPEMAAAVNGYAVGYLAAACKQIGAVLVHYSTDYVFDGTKRDGYAEADMPKPISRYGQSKLLGEQELQKNTDKFYLLRLSKLFGKEAASAAGKKSFVKLMLDLARAKPELDIVDEELSSPTYAPDLAERTRYIIENRLPYGIYHCSNSGAVTWYGFATEIFKISGINVKLNPVPASHFPRPARRPAYCTLLNTKLPPQRPWQEALREFIAQD
jgi:dTDP-4-dehydrorhamnose reductase